MPWPGPYSVICVWDHAWGDRMIACGHAWWSHTHISSSLPFHFLGHHRFAAPPGGLRKMKRKRNLWHLHGLVLACHIILKARRVDHEDEIGFRDQSVDKKSRTSVSRWSQFLWSRYYFVCHESLRRQDYKWNVLGARLSHTKSCPLRRRKRARMKLSVARLSLSVDRHSVSLFSFSFWPDDALYLGLASKRKR